MLRQQATNELRDLLNQHGLKDWHIRLTTDLTRPFLGMCSYKDKCIILNAHHIDTHGETEFRNTIRHEVAHALTPGHQHDDVWAAKARELGCDDVRACVSYGFDARAIDAIRSGANVEVTYEEHIVRTPKYEITRLQDKCPVCGKVAKEKSSYEAKTKEGRKKVIQLECLHVIIKDADSQSPFDEIVFDGDATCKHEWGTGRYYTYCKNCPARRLYQFQVEGARELERANGRLGLFDDMGVGKTIQALAFLKFHPEMFPMLWAGKSATRFQHGKEIVRVLGMDYFPQVFLTGKETLIPGFKTYVVSHDMFRRLPLQMFMDAGIKTLIIDECQAIKNPDSTRTQCIRKVAQKIPHIIPMSGTFWNNRASEAFVTLNLLNPTRYPSYERFVARDVETYWEGNKKKLGGFVNPKQFREKNKDLFIRRERKDVLPEIPPVTRTKLLCKLEDYEQKAYDEAEDRFMKKYNEAVIGGEEDKFLGGMQSNADIMVMRQLIAISKVGTTVEFATEFLEETDRNLVIFLHHIQVGDMIEQQLNAVCDEMNIPRCRRIKAGDKDVEEKRTDFNAGKFRILIASTLAGGEGLNLQSCHDMIQHERQWNPGKEEQAETRLARIGQEADCITATYVHAEGTVDVDMNAIVERKRVFWHESMNDGDMQKWEHVNITKELVERIKSRRSRKVA